MNLRHVKYLADRMIIPSTLKLEHLVVRRRTIPRIVGLPPYRHYTMNTPERIAFVLDFDQTITTKDTISALTTFGLSFQKKRGNDLDEVLKKILNSYSEDYSEHIQKYRPAKEERHTLEEEIAYYRSLRDLELNSFERVSTSDLFKGIESSEWEEFGREVVQDKHVEVRKGFQAFVARILEHGSIWGIVSVNFSSSFIRGVLGASIGNENAPINILANSVTRDGSIVGPEVGKCVLATSDMKLFAMNELARQWSRPWQQSKEKFDRLVYIGDSGTDIECLTAPNVIGIIISEEGDSDLMKTLKRVERAAVPIGEFVGENQIHLYWARNFDEIVSSPLFSSLSREDD